MKELNIEDYKYISKLYLEIKKTLKYKNKIDLVEKLSLVVNFCILLEKLIKLRLSVENKLLVYYSKGFTDDFIFGILKDKIPPTSFEAKTKTFNEVNNLFNKLFKVFSSDEIILLEKIYNIRNAVVHSHSQDNKILDKGENLIKEISTILDKVNLLIEEMFGKKALASIKIVGEEKYSKEELEKILVEEIKKKILYIRSKNPSYYSSIVAQDKFNDSYINNINVVNYRFSNSKLLCPACRNYDLEGKDTEGDNPYNVIYNPHVENLLYLKKYSMDKDFYICSICGLQLTKREYELAQKYDL